METCVEQLSFQSIKEAMRRISPIVHQSPLQGCRTLSELTGYNIHLKLENLQKTGSFKIRGAANKIYRLKETAAVSGVISASAGNHAQGVAWAAGACGVPATVVMPCRAPVAKIKATESYGARVMLYGECYDEAFQYARELKEREGLTFVHAFDDHDVIAGQGTVALEILAKAYDVEAIIAPVGGGGLLAGLALAAKEHNPKIKIIGVQAAGAAAMVQSLAAGALRELSTVNTLADGIAVKRPGDLTFRYIQKYADDVIMIEDQEIENGILFLLERGKMITEGAGVAGVAALLAGKIHLKAQNIAVVVSGGNIDPLLLSKLILAKNCYAVAQ